MGENFQTEYNKLQEIKTKVDWSLTFHHSDGAERKDRVTVYDENANAYEGDYAAYDYQGPWKAAASVHKSLQGNTEAKIIDIGCGTGLVTKELRKLGSYSNIDGLEPACGMLEVANLSGLYKKVYNQFFHIDSGIKEDQYDALMTCGTFMPEHIEADSIKEMVKIIKPGGFVVVCMRDSYLTSVPDLQKLRPYIKEMADQGKIEVVVDKNYENHFQQRPGNCFVLKKLRSFN